MGGWCREHDQGRLGIRRTLAAVFFTSLFLVTSVAVAHADPHFALVEAEARAGDVVHFSITGADGPVTYELEIGPHDVVEDTVGAGSVITGEFTLPHLGDSGKTVTVKAEMRERRDKTTVKRKLRYLGPALPATRPPQPASAPQPASDPPAVLAPAAQEAPPAAQALAALPQAPPHTTPGSATPVSRTKAVPRRSRHRGRQGKPRGRRDAADRHIRSRGKPGRNPARRKARATKPGPRTAPLFDGIPETGAGNGTSGKQGGYASLNAIAPSAAVLTATRATSGGDGPFTAAVLVPGIMGVAALALTATALHRRRRLR